MISWKGLCQVWYLPLNNPLIIPKSIPPISTLMTRCKLEHIFKSSWKIKDIPIQLPLPPGKIRSFMIWQRIQQFL